MRHLLEVFFRQLKSFAAIVVICILVVFVGNYLVTFEYESEAKILINVGREATLPTIAMTQPLNIYLERKDQINSQIQILESRALIQETLALFPADWGKPSAPQTLFQKIKASIKASVKAASQSVRYILERMGLVPEITAEQSRIIWFMQHLEVEAMQGTNVLRVAFSHPHPAMAQEFLKAFLDRYLDLTAKTNNNKSSMLFFRQQTTALKKDLNRAEKKLSDFRNRWSIFDLSMQKNNTSKELMDTTTRIRNKELLLRSLERDLLAYKKAKGQHVESDLSTDLRDDPTLIEMLKMLVAVKFRLSRDLETLGKNHPKIEALMGEIASIRNGLKQEVIRIIENRVKNVGKELTNLQAQKKALESRVQVLDEKGIEMEALQRSVNLKRAAFITYSEKMETSRINTVMDQAQLSSATIFEPPLMPIKPVSPKRMLNFLLSVIAGIILGFFYILLAEMTRATIDNPNEMNAILDTPAQTFLMDLKTQYPLHDEI
ncbi:MAG: hypothetical protein CSA22_09495 [Deltaproteobacteria bacterium]|nr:MAG: hypothetical protein CSA22_09495 [Deltaproteobacteria bacterium]